MPTNPNGQLSKKSISSPAYTVGRMPLRLGSENLTFRLSKCQFKSNGSSFWDLVTFVAQEETVNR